MAEHPLPANEPSTPAAPATPSPSTPTTAMAPTLKRTVVFDPATGQPVVQQVPMFTRQQVAAIIAAAATDLYDADPALEPEFVGKTNLEVMVIRQTRRAARTGDADQVEKLLDRILGKPKQTTESHKIVETYEDALKRIERDEELRRAQRTHTIEAEVVAPKPPDPMPIIDDSPLGDIL